MALRKAFVRLATGWGELPTADTLCPAWSGTAQVPAGTIAAGALTAVSGTVTSTTASGTLAAGTPVTVGVKGLPAGLQAMGGAATADGTVTVFLRAPALLTLSTSATLTVTVVQPR